MLISILLHGLGASNGLENIINFVGGQNLDQIVEEQIFKLVGEIYLCFRFVNELLYIMFDSVIK